MGDECLEALPVELGESSGEGRPGGGEGAGAGGDGDRRDGGVGGGCRRRSGGSGGSLARRSSGLEACLGSVGCGGRHKGRICGAIGSSIGEGSVAS
eukprot:1544610-Prymnesium_polylepis.2